MSTKPKMISHILNHVLYGFDEIQKRNELTTDQTENLNLIIESTEDLLTSIESVNKKYFKYNKITSFISNILNSEKQISYNNQWFKIDQVSIYIRITWIYINGQKLKSIQIVNINIAEKYQNKKQFTNLLTFLESKFPSTCIYIENVIDIRFKTFFVNRGYNTLHEDYDSGNMLSFYRLHN